MLIVYCLKLLVFNFLHSFLVGVVSVVIGLIYLVISNLTGTKRSESPSAVLTFLVYFAVMILTASLPAISIFATRISLDADPSRSPWLWWPAVVIFGVFPMALGVKGSGEEGPAKEAIFTGAVLGLFAGLFAGPKSQTFQMLHELARQLAS